MLWWCSCSAHHKLAYSGGLPAQRPYPASCRAPIPAPAPNRLPLFLTVFNRYRPSFGHLFRFFFCFLLLLSPCSCNRSPSSVCTWMAGGRLAGVLMRKVKQALSTRSRVSVCCSSRCGPRRSWPPATPRRCLLHSTSSSQSNGRVRRDGGRAGAVGSAATHIHCRRGVRSRL